MVDGERILHPLESITWRVSLTDTAASASVSQIFSNTTDVDVLVTFVWPQLPQATVCGVAASFDDGSSCTAVVKGKKAARREFQTSIRKGQSALLIEQPGDDSLRLKLGQLPAGTRITVTVDMALVCDDEMLTSSIRLALPTQIGHRYPLSPPSASSAEREAMFEEATALQEGAMGSGNARFRLVVDVDMATSIASIASPNHEFNLNRINARCARATLSVSTVPSNEIVMIVTLDEPRTPRCLLEPQEAAKDGSVSSAQAAALIALHPDATALQAIWSPLQAAEAEEALEFVFLLDRSGSMNGGNGGTAAIQRATDALQLFLRSLPTKCRFQIVGFGSEFECLFPCPVPLTAESLRAASAHASTLRANLGGTELERPLAYILAQPPSEGFGRRLIVLTDGAVSHTERVLSLVRERAPLARTRVHTVGVGSQVSHGLVDGLAEAGGGSAEYAAAGESMAPKVVRQLRRALAPPMPTLESVEWMGSGVTPPDTAVSGRPPASTDLLEVEMSDEPVEGELSSELSAMADDADVEDDGWAVVGTVPRTVAHTATHVHVTAAAEHLAVAGAGCPISSKDEDEALDRKLAVTCDGQRMIIAATLNVQFNSRVETARLHFRNHHGQRAHLDVPCRVLPAGRRLHAVVGHVITSEIEASRESFESKAAKIEAIGIRLQLLTKHTAMIAVLDRSLDAATETNAEPARLVSANSDWWNDPRADTVEELREVFSLFTHGSDDTIAAADLGGVMRSLGRNPNDPQIRSIVDAHGQGHGKLDFPAFYSWFGRTTRRTIVSHGEHSGVYNNAESYRSLSSAPSYRSLDCVHGVDSAGRPSDCEMSGMDVPVYRSLSSSVPALHTSVPHLPAHEPSTQANGGSRRGEQQLQALALLQSFDGAWAPDVGLIRALGLQGKSAALHPPDGLCPLVWATALVFAFMHVYLRQHVESWSLIAEKARAWLSSRVHDPSELITTATRHLVVVMHQDGTLVDL
eukprot:CAMPEP_0115856194 /NCGR_PEP_ID=MMETSP0287-20121206/14926_1 /TAXON_ID=412157 /ORGANISM="Chrysochromulina rotalis, Strain UIO044" /LENGTH=979 /DNA_ID=CAMNT_0003310359 /DNA_START=37 /DNA_END=2976 /DNA_ORIENTATION=-